jgi:hypothetical protein
MSFRTAAAGHVRRSLVLAETASERSAQPSNAEYRAICLYECQSIKRYIHFAHLIGEAQLVRSPVDIDREQGSVGNGGPFLRAKRCGEGRAGAEPKRCQ